MDSSLVIILFSAALFFLLAVTVWVFWSIRRTSKKIDDLKPSQDQNQALSLMQQQIGHLTQNINLQLQNLSGQFQKTTGDIGGTLGEVKRDLGKMEVVTREVLDKAKNISNLESLLKAPKFRGGLGELFLGDLLSQILPPAHYTLQHRFKSGEVVDAAIRIGENFVPIDSKFPLENFKKHITEDNEKEKEDLRKKFVVDVKRHINEISNKYILPDEGTYDFALMYVPAENIYYETILKDDKFGEERSIFSYAIQKKVIPVSPNSFYAYLSVIVLGLKGLHIEKSAQTIIQSLARLQGDLRRFRKEFEILGSHLNKAKGKFDDADKRLEKFTDKLQLVQESHVDLLPEADEEQTD